MSSKQPDTRPETREKLDLYIFHHNEFRGVLSNVYMTFCAEVRFKFYVIANIWKASLTNFAFTRNYFTFLSRNIFIQHNHINWHSAIFLPFASAIGDTVTVQIPSRWLGIIFNWNMFWALANRLIMDLRVEVVLTWHSEIKKSYVCFLS